MGIVNGTTNFILSAMDATGAGYAETLEEASRLGYAEADPTADVDGFDAASKAAILASLAFHTRVTASDVYREGIRAVSAADIAAAKGLGRTVKLLAICERVVSPSGQESVAVRVHPAMIPRTHPLASVNGAFNAVFVEATEKIQKDVSTGASLTSSMNSTGVFPNMVLQMCAIGEESGSIDHMLGKAADFYEEEVDEAVKGLSTLMEPIIIVILGGLIGGIVVSMYLPIFKLGQVV